MIWLAVLLLLCGLGYVLFHKPPLNVMGAGWQPPRLDPPSDALPAKALRGSKTSGAKALPAGPQPAGLLSPAPDIEDAITLRLDRDPDATPGAEDLDRDPSTAPEGADEVTAVGDEPHALAETAESADWSAEDAVTAPMAYPAAPVLDGTAGQNAQPIA
jgi:hypothetical protein